MNKIVAVTMAAFAAVSAFAEAQAPAAKKAPSEKYLRMIAARDARIAAEGGLLAAPVRGRVVRFMTTTDKVPVADLEKIASDISRILGIVVEVCESGKESNQRTGCLITVNYQEKVTTLLVAPEEPWAALNVKNLLADNPKPELFKARLEKEVWRAFAYASGAANSQMQPCLMRPIFSVQDLDSEVVHACTPSVLSSIMQTADRLNYARKRNCTYKTACQEGWAPRPTNDVQKAIWDKVRELPSDPIKIKYDPKRDK